MPEQLLIMTLSAIMTSYAPQPGESAPGGGAPSGTAQTEYCMRVGPITGSLVETVECWTREEWAEQGVDVDKEWAKEGVRTIG